MVEQESLGLLEAKPEALKTSMALSLHICSQLIQNLAELRDESNISRQGSKLPQRRSKQSDRK